MTDTLSQGLIAGFVGGKTTGQPNILEMSSRGSLWVEQRLPQMAELARAGVLYGCNTGAGTAKAPVIAMPTTAAAWGLYNGYSGTQHLLVHSIYSALISGTAGLGAALLVGLPGTIQGTALTAYTSSVHAAITPGSSAPSAVFAGGVTLASAPVWNVVANRSTLAAVEVGSGLRSGPEWNGVFLVPPGYCLGATVLSAAGSTPLHLMGFLYSVIASAVG